ncbi:cellulase family glycosylhydrolase [Paenibacillus oryzisoli]|uniref:cellulase family glycosylhydrolase n=1 Tax=Paenibacillus oryzisoli TaxID=1850517 RepID=UPI003D2AEF8A
MENQLASDVIGFVRAEGTRLVNGEGREVLLRGVGLGNWLLPEGYMWKFPQQGDRPRRIEQMIKDLMGPRKAEHFWELYYERYIGKADIVRIATEGFNSIRVPVNARFLLKDGETLQIKENCLAYIDRVIDWCKEHRLYVILDLHGAPGGQTGTNIDDSEKDHPDLFTDDACWRLTVQLWRFLADRYKDEWIVAGYDLLNEPLPDWFSTYNSRLLPLYKEIVSAIREVDQRHLIILEGAHWATDWSIFTEKIDDNLMLQFHKYWSAPDTESLRPYLDKRDEWNVPIFMGEGGENGKDWYAGAFQLFEDHGISWNFWPWKKLDASNAPCSISMPADWHLIIDYLEGGERPDAATAERMLWSFLEGLPLDRCVYHEDVVRSLFRRAPIRIPAVFYGYQGEGISFGAAVREDRQSVFRTNDGTDIRSYECGEMFPNYWKGQGKTDKRLFVQLAEGDWLAYDFTMERSESAAYTVRLKMGAMLEAGACVKLSVNGKEIGRVAVDWKEGAWQQIELKANQLPNSGRGKLVIQAERNPIGIEWLEIGQR